MLEDILKIKRLMIGAYGKKEKMLGI